MKSVRLGCFAALFLCWQPAAMFCPAPDLASGRTTQRKRDLSAFEPLDRWKAAVVSGDKVALTSLYTTSPPAGAKTPQGETHDASEEPMFWSSLRPAGLSRFDVKVLEVRNLEHGAKAFVLRCEVKFQAPNGQGEKS